MLIAFKYVILLLKCLRTHTNFFATPAMTDALSVLVFTIDGGGVTPAECNLIMERPPTILAPKASQN